MPPGGAGPTRTHFTYFPGAVRLPETAADNTKNRSHMIEVRITEPGDGILVALGGLGAGYALYVQDGRPVYHCNFFERERTEIVSDTRLPFGASTVGFEFLYDGGGAGKGGLGILSINGLEVGPSRIDRAVPGRFGIYTFAVGMDTGSPVTPESAPPFAFTGVIERVDIDLGPADLDPAEERRLHARFKAGKDY